MLSRFISRPSNLRFLTLASSKSHFSNPNPHPPSSNHTSSYFSRYFSSSNNNKNQPTSTSDSWKLSSENDDSIDSVFGEDTENLEGLAEDSAQGWEIENDSWLSESMGKEDDDDIFKEADDGLAVAATDDRITAEEYKPWSFKDEDKAEEEKVFDVGKDDEEISRIEIEDRAESEKREQEMVELEKEEKALSAVLEGPKRAFGDLIESSGITDEMLDSLMALKDLDGVQGLPPLREIEDLRYMKNTKRATRADIERQKQEEVAKSRVRTVDTKGRAYGTGRRKCSIARVWVEPGEGNFVVNDKQFDVYFPILDHRAALLRPFSETKTLGRWDVSCTVKGGGISGQVGAIRLGISRALQNWEPEMRPPLKEAGFLTRDSRVVERKKPGKAKARKSFQWVKR